MIFLKLKDSLLQLLYHIGREHRALASFGGGLVARLAVKVHPGLCRLVGGESLSQQGNYYARKQVAAAAPVSARRDDVPADVIEHELAIYKAQAAESGKPEAIQEKMAQGRLEKYFKESVLTEQEFVKDSSVTIGQLAKNVGKSLGDDVEVMSFIRYTFGE